MKKFRIGYTHESFDGIIGIGQFTVFADSLEDIQKKAVYKVIQRIDDDFDDDDYNDDVPEEIRCLKNFKSFKIDIEEVKNENRN